MSIINRSLVLAVALAGISSASAVTAEALVDRATPAAAAPEAAVTSIHPGALMVIFTPPRKLEGYTWRLQPIDETIVRAKPGQPFGAFVEPARPDGPSEMQWTFEAVGPGETTLKFDYVADSGARAFSESFTVPVTVR